MSEWKPISNNVLWTRNTATELADIWILPDLSHSQLVILRLILLKLDLTTVASGVTKYVKTLKDLADRSNGTSFEILQKAILELVSKWYELIKDGDIKRPIIEGTEPVPSKPEVSQDVDTIDQCKILGNFKTCQETFISLTNS
jgi:hypothetical protein